MSPAERYLRVPSAYFAFLGGLRWSALDDALEYQDGSTFAMNEEIALFLEGFASSGRLVHVAFVLHLLYLLNKSNEELILGFLRLKKIFVAAGRPVRIAGAFCADLCREIPEVSGSLDLQDVLNRLRDPARPMRWFVASLYDNVHPTELPPLAPADFLKEILKQLDTYKAEELWDWMRHGRGPTKRAGETIARALPPPRTLAGALAALLNRPRLAAARSFVDPLLSALALPPRRQVRPLLSMGGYADVTIHGQPDQLLPSQFALDELDFLRRYADRELLYFRREEPHARTRHELIVLLDQGVRTWGNVRLVLAAAVLALGRQAARNKLPFLVATTSSHGEALDPVAANEDELGEMMEASDLSANPGLVLERVLERPLNGSRDVVLLTHPRNLLEEDVRTAALRANHETRLLALTLDGHGQATLCELRHGAPVSIRQFQVDLNVASQPLPAPPSKSAAAWRGDVEPVAFPFRFGSSMAVGPELFDFDHDGRWLLTVAQDGVLHAWATDGSGNLELLPRALVRGELFGKVEAVVGVIGGFVVVGRKEERIAATHYDFDKRTCSAYELGEGARAQDWCYSPEHHTILTHVPSGSMTHALDLGTGAVFPGGDVQRWGRVRATWEAVGQGIVPTRRLVCWMTSGILDGRVQSCHLDEERGELELRGVLPDWKPFIPLADGRPVLAGATLLTAKCRRHVLAALFRAVQGHPWTLRLFRGPEGVALAEYPLTRPVGGFALSADGKLLARQLSDSRIEVCDTEGGDGPLIKTYAGGYSTPSDFRLGDKWIMLRAGRQNLHLLSWESGRLELHCTRSNESLDDGLHSAGEMTTFNGVSGLLHYDRLRFIAGATTTVSAVLDRFGQIVVLDAEEKLVCMFFVFRDRLSGWMPDGTCYGPDSPSRQPATPHDLEHFGRALTHASELGRTTLCK